jgi:energy-converting hydrogenase Eha subunit A
MKSCPTCKRTYPDDNLAFCLMDGAVLSAPYDPAESPRRPATHGSTAPPTEVLNAPKVTAETSPPLQSTIRAPAPQVPTLPSDKVKRSSQGKQNRSPTPLRWIILVILLISWLLGFLGHIGGSLIHFLLFVAVIALIYNLVAGRRKV